MGSGVSYDASADSITVTARFTIVTVHVVLTKSSAGLLGRTLTVETAEDRARWFDEFRAFHGRTYTGSELIERRAIFEENLDLITERDLDGDLGHHWINKFSDMSA